MRTLSRAVAAALNGWGAVLARWSGSVLGGVAGLLASIAALAFVSDEPHTGQALVGGACALALAGWVVARLAEGASLQRVLVAGGGRSLLRDAVSAAAPALRAGLLGLPVYALSAAWRWLALGATAMAFGLGLARGAGGGAASAALALALVLSLPLAWVTAVWARLGWVRAVRTGEPAAVAFFEAWRFGWRRPWTPWAVWLGAAGVGFFFELFLAAVLGAGLSPAAGVRWQVAGQLLVLLPVALVSSVLELVVLHTYSQLLADDGPVGLRAGPAEAAGEAQPAG